MELNNIFKILRRWSWLIISIVIVIGLGLLLGLKLAKPVYQAQVKLQLSTPQQEDVAAFDEYRYISQRDMITVARNNFQEILNSDEVYNRTIQGLNIDPEQTKFDLQTDTNYDSDFLIVIVKAPSSSLAVSIANTLVDQSVDYYGELRAKPTLEEMNLYAEQLQTAEEAYRDAEDAFSSFKEENNIGVLQNEIAISQRLLEQLQSERDQRSLEVSVKDPTSQLSDLIIQRQEELDRLLTLEPMYLILEENYKEAGEEYRQTLSPEVREAVRAVAEEKYRNAEQAFNEFKIQNNITSLQNEIAIYYKLLEQLQLGLDQQLLEGSDGEDLLNQVDGLILQREEELDRLSGLQPIYNVLEEKTNEAQAKYQHILDKYTESELKSTVVRAANFIQIVEPAHEPALVVNNSIKLLALGIMGSLGLGIFLAFLFDYLIETNEKVLIPDNLESQSIMGLPILGRIPVLEKHLCDPDSPEAEKIRHLRTNILLSPTGHSIKTILIASPQPGDGKTLTAANLGAVIADGKTKTVLVDGDFRNPYLHEAFGQPNLGGMADLLSTDENSLVQLLSKYIRDTDIPGLSLLTAGKLSKDPSSLLSSSNMKLIFDELSRRFDFVLIDSPPFYIAPDSIILSKYADGILLVVRPGKTSLNTAEETVHSFNSNGFNILGVALNRTSVDQYSYRYYTNRESKTSLLEKMLALIPAFTKPVDPDLLSMEQVARMLGVRKKTVARWCQAGQLTVRRINWQWWVKREELQDFLLNRFGGEIPSDYSEKVIKNEEANLNTATPAIPDELEKNVEVSLHSNHKSEKILFTIDEAAREIGVQKKTIVRWCREGRIAGIKLKGRWWVKQEELQSQVKRFGENPK